jgi:pSer/pThr/pTyr-binding forkhead associated (FHA) protein
MYRLEMKDDLGRKLSFPLAETGEVSLGRQSDNDIILSDRSISRHHCRFVLDAGSVTVEDLGSSNGVLVRGQRIGAPTAVMIGDEVVIGDNRFFLDEVDDDAPTRQTFVGDLHELSRK